MSLTLILILVISGCLVGFINALSAGGTVISIALYLALGLPAYAANATNRIGVLFQSSSTALMMNRQHLLPRRTSLLLALPTMLGALVGALASTLLTAHFFSYCMGAILLMMIVFLFAHPSALYSDNEEKIKRGLHWWHYAVFFAIGLYGGFIQVGTGFFLMTAGTILVGYDIIKTNAMKTAIMFLYTLVALAVFCFQGQIYWSYGLLHSLGAVFGAWLATRFAVKKGTKYVRWVIIVVIILTALNLFGTIDLQSFFKNITTH